MFQFHTADISAAVIILLVWIYYSAFILVLGAEFNSVLFRVKREGESFGKRDGKIEPLKGYYE